MKETKFKNWLNVLLNILLFLSLILFLYTIVRNLTAKQQQQNATQNVTVEGLANNKPTAKDNTSIIVNKSDAFCENHRGSSHILEESCGKLTHGNCNSTSCCVWTSNNKCVAGKVDGPTFNTHDNGKTKNLDYYYYKNKCYGAKCPPT
jgi:hypothetical protein